MTFTEDGKALYAGTNEIHRYGKKAQEAVKQFMEPKNGYYSIQTDGGKNWSLGTSDGKYGEYIKINDTFFSVNKGGFAYAKVGTDKGEKLATAIKGMLEEMVRLNKERVEALESIED